MSYDAGFFLDLGVCLPAPSSAWSALFFTDAKSWRYFKAQGVFNFFEKSFIQNVFDFDNFVRLLRLEIEFSHGDFGTEVAAAYAARLFVFGRTDGMAAVLTDIAVLPRAVSISFFYHSDFP